jgi:hypothetical protein
VKTSWTEQELLKLHQYYPHVFPQEYQEVFGAVFPSRSVESCTQMARRMKIAKKDLRVFYPRNYASDTDGGYISGLTDGEGHFRATSTKTPVGRKSYRVEFKIDLRADDRSVLEWACSYFGCGSVTTQPTSGNPMALFTVGGLYEIMQAVVPHFDRYPLKAKKLKDYLLWRRVAIKLTQKYMQALTEEDDRELEQLCSDLCQGRKYMEALHANPGT